MRTMTISLSDQQANQVEEAVADGSYASSSEVVRDALRLWEQRETLRMLDTSDLKQAYDAGIASGPGRAVDRAELLAELKAEARRNG